MPGVQRRPAAKAKAWQKSVVIRVPPGRHSVDAAGYAKSASADISPGSVLEANQFKVFPAQSLKGCIVDPFAELLG
jgi:hypothetical protein